MLKKILIGTLVTLLVLGVLGGVAAVSFGVGSRLGLAQAQMVARAPNSNNDSQVRPPRLRGPNDKGQPNRGNSPRAFAQPFGGGGFQPNMMITRSRMGGNPFSAVFGFIIPLLVVVLLVLIIMRLARGQGMFWGGGHRGDKMMFMRGGPGAPNDAPPFFEEWHKQAHGDAPKDEEKK